MAEAGETVYAHGMHDLITAFLLACRAESRHALIQMPPEHGKSARAWPFLVWCLGQSERLRIGIVSADADLGEQHVSKIRKALTSPICQVVFPHIRPDFALSHVQHGEWSKRKLYLQGQADPAFEFYPLHARSEGHRLDVLWFDDVCTREGLFSEAERQRASAAVFGTYLNRLTAPSEGRPGGFVIWTNNCWYRDDAFHQARNRTGFSTLWVAYDGVDALHWEVLHPPAGWRYGVGGRLPLWSAVWPRERLIQKQAESAHYFTRLYEGRAIQAEECRFPSRNRWARYDEGDLARDLKYGQVFGFLDPSGGRSARKGDYAAAIAVLKVNEQRALLVNCYVARETPQQQINACFDIEREWLQRARGIRVFEIEALEKDHGWIAKPFLETSKRLAAHSDPACRLPWRLKGPHEPKESRIERLDPFIRNGWLLWPADLEDRVLEGGMEGESWRLLAEQVEEWPMADHDDGPDALAGAMALAFPLVGIGEEEIVVYDALADSILPASYS